jgi:hypothetical protein
MHVSTLLLPAAQLDLRLTSVLPSQVILPKGNEETEAFTDDWTYRQKSRKANRKQDLRTGTGRAIVIRINRLQESLYGH